MSDINRDEVKSRLEASEARIATAVEGMRSDNDRLRSQMSAIAASFQANAEIAKEQMASFGSEMLRISVDTRAVISNEVHNLRAWVLTGALTGLVATLGLIASNFVKSEVAATPTAQMQQQPVVIQLSPELFQSPSKHPSETRQEQMPDGTPQK
jgi:hypothetical protein